MRAALLILALASTVAAAPLEFGPDTTRMEIGAEVSRQYREVTDIPLSVRGWSCGHDPAEAAARIAAMQRQAGLIENQTRNLQDTLAALERLRKDEPANALVQDEVLREMHLRNTLAAGFKAEGVVDFHHALHAAGKLSASRWPAWQEETARQARLGSFFALLRQDADQALLFRDGCYRQADYETVARTLEGAGKTLDAAITAFDRAYTRAFPNDLNLRMWQIR